jgi:hypothetical protein
MKKFINRLIYLIVLIRRINWLRLCTLLHSDSKNVVWIYQSAFKDVLVYIRGNAFLNDLALINAFVRRGVKFKIVIGPKIGAVSDKNVYYNISKLFNSYNLSNHSSSIIGVVRELEMQNNIVFPSLHELKLWENKAYMHRVFEELGIRSPKTWIVSRPDDIEQLNSVLRFPCLLKECNSSGSNGLFKARSFSELKELIYHNRKLGKYEFLVQELIEMRKDLRVIFVNDEIVLHYWRINESSSWRPTSTGHGSKVDFFSFPEHWRSDILVYAKKLGIRTGAFDIVWEKDDLATEPLILEVSPSYMPNPSIPEKWRNLSYKEYKDKVLLRGSYMREYVDVVFSIKDKVVEEYLSS